MGASYSAFMISPGLGIAHFLNDCTHRLAVGNILLPFAIEEFSDQCRIYDSNIPHGDRLHGAVDVFLKREDIREESKRKLLVDDTARFYGL